ncbi:MAG: alpha/beta hydrolase [Planctomycetes bacterium]|nr:alpha/beta hydrolase [Planctomycetota bacterium]
MSSSLRLSLAALGLLAGCCSPPAVPDKAESVVVIHGLGRTPASMKLLVSRIEGSGYSVTNFGYPSTSEPIEALTALLGAELEERFGEGSSEVHFVTHSMGGVLVRSYLNEQPEPHQGRVVMLSPPNQGSEIIDTFADSELLRSLLGPAGMKLGTDEGVTSELGPVRFELGVLTGDRSLSPLGSWLIPGPDDGKVSVESASVEGVSDFRVVHATHTFIMNRRDVAEEVVHFLERGEFLPLEPEDD